MTAAESDLRGEVALAIMAFLHHAPPAPNCDMFPHSTGRVGIRETDGGFLRRGCPHRR
jgi:hypothetical protein